MRFKADLCQDSRYSLPPKVFETCGRQFCVADNVLNVFVPEVGLKRARVVAFVGESIAAGMPQHVWMGFEVQPNCDADALNHPGKSRRGERAPAL